MNKEYAESCRVISEYWALKAEGKPMRPLEYCVIGCGHSWCGADIDHIINPKVFFYRWKPETVKHKGGEHPKPCQSVEEVCNAPDPHRALIDSEGVGVFSIRNYSDEYVQLVVKAGLAHPTKEAALQHARVMMGLGGSDE